MEAEEAGGEAGDAGGVELGQVGKAYVKENTVHSLRMSLVMLLLSSEVMFQCSTR